MGYLDAFIRKETEVELGGTPYKFTELSLADFAEFRARIVEQRDKNKDKRRERLLEEAKQIGGIEPLELLKELEKPPTDEEVEAEMETVEGLGFLAYLSLKYAYPGITEKEVMGMISVERTEEIAKALMGGSGEEVKKKPVKKPSAKQQQ